MKILFYICNCIKFVMEETWKTIKRPWRIISLLRPSALQRYMRFNKVKLKTSNKWASDSHGLITKTIDDYESYIELQAMKLEHVDLISHEIRFRKILAERLKNLDFISTGKTVLCLGARLGSEVRAFIALGCFAVGIDLNPGDRNKYVLCGDFQKLQMASDSVDILYTNSLDHAFDLSSTVKEMCRVLKSDGHIIIEADPGTEEADKVPPDMWQMLSWKKTDDLVNVLDGLGLKLIFRASFEYPRGGEQLIFVLNNIRDEKAGRYRCEDN